MSGGNVLVNAFLGNGTHTVIAEDSYVSIKWTRPNFGHGPVYQDFMVKVERNDSGSFNFDPKRQSPKDFEYLYLKSI